MWWEHPQDCAPWIRDVSPGKARGRGAPHVTSCTATHTDGVLAHFLVENGKKSLSRVDES